MYDNTEEHCKFIILQMISREDKNHDYEVNALILLLLLNVLMC